MIREKSLGNVSVPTSKVENTPYYCDDYAGQRRIRSQEHEQYQRVQPADFSRVAPKRLVRPHAVEHFTGASKVIESGLYDVTSVFTIAGETRSELR